MVAMAAYRAGVSLIDRRTGIVCDYTRKQGILHSEMILPAAPEWAQDRGELWNRSEAADRRGDAIIAREIQLSLPHELTPAHRRDLTLYFARSLVEKYGLAIDCAIHAPHRNGDERNHHAHLLICQRPFDKTSKRGFGNKSRIFDAIAQRRAGESPTVEALRAQWADMVNAALKRASVQGKYGGPILVDHRSYKRRGIDQEPTIKEGVAATAIKRRGQHSDRAALNAEIKKRNAEREKLDQQIVRTQTQLAKLVQAYRQAARRRKAMSEGQDRTKTGSDRSHNPQDNILTELEELAAAREQNRRLAAMTPEQLKARLVARPAHQSASQNEASRESMSLPHRKREISGMGLD